MQLPEWISIESMEVLIDGKKEEKENSMEYRNDSFPWNFYLCDHKYRFLLREKEINGIQSNER